MKSLSIALILILGFAGLALGQSISVTVAKVRQIKLLESTREDVRRILRGFEAGDDEYHSQEFSNDDLTIEVTYSSGTCTDDRDEEDPSEVWNVKEWTVTRIEIEPDEGLPIRHAGLNLSTYTKEPRFPEPTDSLIFHSKAAGFAVKTREDGVETIIFFPPRANVNKLCRTSTAAKGFYSRKGWFSQVRPYDNSGICSLPANVTGLNLSAGEIDSGPDMTVSVATVAVDPENDVLTYNYTVSGGKIIGTGANVTWDLTGVSTGTYTITAGVDDGAGIVGQTVTRTVVVK